MACCAASLVFLFLPSASPVTAGLPPVTSAQVCVGARTAPRIQVGASLDACWICSSLTPWMAGWSSKLCAQIPWPTNSWSVATRIGFELPP